MISIIIPLRTDQGFLKPCIEACLSERWIEVEIIVLPDEPLPWDDPRIVQEATGPVSPAAKRNRGAALSHGDILAFIDDDTCPRPGWLQAARPHFDNPDVGAVGGPSVTPASDPFWAQVSGAAYESWMLSGSARLRYQPEAACEIDDFPSCNLLVRKVAFEAAGGFATNFWPGEDTAFCLALIQQGYRIRYEPGAVIEHHRRASLKSHLQQLANYGLHRGYFAKRYPETSRRPLYFAPAGMLVLGTLLTIATMLGSSSCAELLTALAVAYLLLALLSLPGKPPRVIGATVGVIFLSHIVYGAAFLRGLLAKQLPEETGHRR